MKLKGRGALKLAYLMTLGGAPLVFGWRRRAASRAFAGIQKSLPGTKPAGSVLLKDFLLNRLLEAWR